MLSSDFACLYSDLSMADEVGRAGDVSPDDEAGTFRADAAGVLKDLRLGVLGVLADLPGISKPAELEKALGLDKTLSWQIFQVTSAVTALSFGTFVPSRKSIERFLHAAKGMGVNATKLRQVLNAYDDFDELIETHAGDRVTFNTMVSSATGIDNEWLSTDLQHRRDMFRGFSHAMGLRAKTRLQLGIVADSGDGRTSDNVLISGLVDLRVLQPLRTVQVYGTELVGPSQKHGRREPLRVAADGSVLLPEFSTRPLPPLITTKEKTDAGTWIEVALDRPVIGKKGTSTLMFGEKILHHVLSPDEPRYWNGTVSRPFEVFLVDMLVQRGSLAGMMPKAEVFWGVNRIDQSRRGVQPVTGNFTCLSLGSGPDALATPDVPNYPTMVRSATETFGWDIDDFNAFRIRIEFPIYQTSVRLRWVPA